MNKFRAKIIEADMTAEIVGLDIFEDDKQVQMYRRWDCEHITDELDKITSQLTCFETNFDRIITSIVMLNNLRPMWK